MATSTTPDRPIPHFAWVFRSDLVLGQVATGQRTTRFQGHTVPYQPDSDIGGGARWCSSAWLSRTDTGRRGLAIRAQRGMSRFGMQVRGLVTGGTVLVIPADQVTTAMRIAADLTVLHDTDPTQGVTEWSVALIREPGHTRPTVGFDQLPEAARQRLNRELDIEWIITFAEGDMNATHDLFQVTTPDGEHVATRSGQIHHDHEQLPHQLIEMAHAAGVSPPPTPSSTDAPAILVEHRSYRPLEPDELDGDATPGSAGAQINP